jgi:hypothetical protein
LIAPNGNTVVTRSITFGAADSSTVLAWASSPTTGSFYIALERDLIGPFLWSDSTLSADIQTQLTAISRFIGSTVSGSIPSVTLNFATFAGSAYQGATLLTWGASPIAGGFSLTLGGYTTVVLPYNATTAQVETAIRALPGFGQICVGTAPVGMAGYFINWRGISVPAVTIATNTTTKALTIASADTTDQAFAPVLGIQSVINIAEDLDGTLPFGDVSITGTPSQYQINFGAFSPQPGSPASGATGQPIITLSSNTLSAVVAGVSVFANINIVQNIEGQPARGVGTATCTQVGAIAIAANTLTVIGSPMTGWTSITNPLDCLKGRSIETDTQAKERRNQLLTAAGNSTLAACIAASRKVAGVTSVTGFQNTSLSPVQFLSFASTPTTGTYQLTTQVGQTAPIAWNATSIAIQNAIQALAGFASAQVTGNSQYGYQIDFGTTVSGLPVALIQVTNASSMDVIPTVTFTRAAKSIELVVDGGTDAAIARAILGASAGGIQTYGSPVRTVNGNPIAGSSSMVVDSAVGLTTGLSIGGYGIIPGTTIQTISGVTLTLSQSAVGTMSETPMQFSHAQQVVDAFGNPYVIQFSRPSEIPFYIALALTTDLYNTPGSPSSGLNTKATFKTTSIIQIQSELAAIGNAFSIGGTVIGFGTNGLVGAFNDILGIVGYSLAFGTAPNPTNTASISLLPTQKPLFEQGNILVSYV